MRATQDGTFTCTLFLPAANFTSLESDPSELLPQFFDQHFPGVTALIPPDELVDAFNANPHLPLITIKCTPYHFSSSVVILGDAAHAMVPFYGQGMNAGLEDVRILFEVMDRHVSHPFPDLQEKNKEDDLALSRARALAEYTSLRTPDAHAINDLALQNYVEMREAVLSQTYRLRKRMEEWLSMHVPRLGWQTKYSRVSFGNERYSEVVAQDQQQGKMLVRGLIGALFTPVVGTAIFLCWQYKQGKLPKMTVQWAWGLLWSSGSSQ